MQVSIYLDEKTVKSVDRTARRAGKSRSEYIQLVLAKSLPGHRQVSVFNEVFGVLDSKAAEDLIRVLKANRRNSSRFRS